MIVGDVFRECMAEGTFTNQDEPRERFLLHGADPALGVGVEIRRPWRQWHSLHPSHIDELLKARAVFPVPVMDEILSGG
jgi:hypothetical protein